MRRLRNQSITHFFKRALNVAALLLVMLFPAISAAQDAAPRNVWIQIEATPTLAKIEPRLRAYAGRFPDVSGFRMKSGWYVVAIGPYTRVDAEQFLKSYRREGRIPSDSLLAMEGKYVEQIWPIGDTQPKQEPPQHARVPPADTPPQQFDKTTPPAPDEGHTEAFQSEAALSDAEKTHVQRALAWAGVYEGPIDAQYGATTRDAMARWQLKKGYLATGVLTTAQRTALNKDYDSILEDLKLAPVRDDATGISVLMPTALVRFERQEFPFAVYGPTTDFPAQVVLISRTGDFRTFKGLYTLLQSSEFTPGDGQHSITPTEFRISGADSRTVSHSQATFKNGQIKGFMLIWPTGDEQRQARVLEKMQESFSAFGGTLAEPAIATGSARKDYALGVESAAQPAKLSRSGFYVSADGMVMTTAEVAQNCQDIRVNGHPARTLIPDASKYLALLRLEDPVTPPAYATWTEKLRVNTDVISAGFSFGGLLGAPNLSFGRVTELNAADKLIQLELNADPRDAGGPVFSADGGVAGVLWSGPDSAAEPVKLFSQAVPDTEIQGLLRRVGLSELPPSGDSDLPLPALTRQARDMTVLVECR